MEPGGIAGSKRDPKQLPEVDMMIFVPDLNLESEGLRPFRGGVATIRKIFVCDNYPEGHPWRLNISIKEHDCANFNWTGLWDKQLEVAHMLVSRQSTMMAGYMDEVGEL